MLVTFVDRFFSYSTEAVVLQVNPLGAIRQVTRWWLHCNCVREAFDLYYPKAFYFVSFMSMLFTFFLL